MPRPAASRTSGPGGASTTDAPAAAPAPAPGVSEPPRGTPFPPDLHDARHLWLKGGLLAVWALASFGACYFARDLPWPVGPWPLGYWMAAQGAVLVFIGIVFAYCWAMNRLERQDARAAEAAAAAAPPGTPGHG